MTLHVHFYLHLAKLIEIDCDRLSAYKEVVIYNHTFKYVEEF